MLRLHTRKVRSMKVLSLFDGLSCGRLALERAGIEVESYYASEIDKYASTISKKNWPDIIPIGDVTQVSYKDGVLHTQFGSYQTDIDMVIGGSPCQTISIAGDGSGFDGKSGLFYEWVRILREVNPEYFLLENVCMKKEWENVITQEVGVAPIMINSALVSAQNRKRLYWTNIEGITQPTDKGVLLKDILQENVGAEFFYSEKAISYLDRSKINKRFANYSDSKKSCCLVANFCKSLPYNVYVDKEKSYCLTANYANMACVNYNKGQGQIVFDNKSIRKLTPVECERLQTIPDNYTKGVSNSQRYKMIGNGWTVDIISWIFKGLKNEEM